MPAPEEISVGALPRDRECSYCGHGWHRSKCADDLGDGVLCPCRCPIPGGD